MNSECFPLPRLVGTLALTWLTLPASVRAGEFTSSDSVKGDSFGRSISLSGSVSLVGAPVKQHYTGAAYIFHNDEAPSGTTTEAVKLTASDKAENSDFAYSLSLFGNIGLVGGPGAGYLFRNLDTATGIITETARLTASDRSAENFFGYSTSVSGNSGLVGASGAAYLFRNLDTATGTVAEVAKLTTQDSQAVEFFGQDVSLSGHMALVAGGPSSGNRGAAYLYRNLGTATGTLTEAAKLTASDGGAGDYLGISLCLSGNSGLLGAVGAAYFYRNLDTAAGNITETAKLTSSEADELSGFGSGLSLSGNTALVGDASNGSSKGAAYLFANLNTATGTITETVKLTASDGFARSQFGSSVALDGDRFIIGAPAYTGFSFLDGIGKVYTGRVSAFTTLDAGGATRFTDGLSFVSQDDWIAGQNSDSNLLVLSVGDSGNVTAAGKKVMVGQNAGSDGNILAINGSLTANTVLVGAAGNTGNSLWVGGGGIVTTTGGVILSPGSIVGGDGTINGNLKFSAASSLIFSTNETLTVNGSVLFDGSFGVTNLIGLDVNTPNGIYTLIDGTSTNFAASGLSNWGEANAYDLGGGKSAWFEAGSLRLVVVPEADTALLILLAGTSAALRRRSSRRRLQSV